MATNAGPRPGPMRVKCPPRFGQSACPIALFYIWGHHKGPGTPRRKTLHHRNVVLRWWTELVCFVTS